MSTLLPISYLIEIFYVLSFWHEVMSDGWLLRVVPLTYLGLNVYLNLYKLIKVGPNGKAAPLPTVMKPGFRYCHSCQLNSPPRVCNLFGRFEFNVFRLIIVRSVINVCGDEIIIAALVQLVLDISITVTLSLPSSISGF